MRREQGFNFNNVDEVDINVITGYKGIYNRVFKRIIDIVLSLFFLILLFPIILLIAVAIVIDSGFPVFLQGAEGRL